jgi:FMN phosphatase YigB (HAD superfamily)
MKYKIHIFDQDWTLYSKDSPLWKTLSLNTMEWLCDRWKMSPNDFVKFKIKFPNFIDWLKFLDLNLVDWHNDVQKWMLDNIDQLLFYNKDLHKKILSLKKTYLVTLSWKDFSYKVLDILKINDLFNEKFYLEKADKWKIYNFIQNQNNVKASEILVVWDSFNADILPAINLSMDTILINSESSINKQIINL